MTRRGVVRWAARAFLVRPITVEMEHYHGDCVVTVGFRGLELAGGGDMAYAYGKTWGDCVRKLEAAYLSLHALESAPCPWFRSQILVHEHPTMLTMRALAGGTLKWARPRSDMNNRLTELGATSGPPRFTEVTRVKLVAYLPDARIVARFRAPSVGSWT
jgi:hypothetical protein